MNSAQIYDLLKVSIIARPGNFELLNAAEWKYICDKVKRKYPEMFVETLSEIIDMAIEGSFNKGFPPINSMTIFRWIHSYLNPKYRIAGRYHDGGSFDRTEPLKEYLPIKNNPNNKISIDEVVYEKY